MVSNFEMNLSWSALLKQTAEKTMRDDAQGLASQLAYYFFLALFPALLCLLAIASFFPLQDFTGQVVRSLGRVAPADVIEIIRQQMANIGQQNHGGLLTIGLLGALWSSSSAMVAVMGAMNKTYEITEARPWWRVRVTAIVLTVALTLLVVISFTLVVVGPQLADAVAHHFAFGAVFVWSWQILQWPIAFALVVVGIGIVYYFAPDAERMWVWLTPGTLVATILWLVGSLVFRWYAVNYASYEATYGAIGGVILLLLWFYLSGLVIVIGAEINAEIEHASAWAKAPGEKVPGQKKKIGAAAARAYRDVSARTPAPPEPHLPPALPPYRSPTVLERLVAALLVARRSGSRTKP